MNVRNLIGIYCNKYRSLPFPVKAGFWFTISGCLQKSISFVTMPIFTRLLNTSEYGVVTVFNSWENIFLLIITLNVFYGAFNTAMMDFEKERDSYSSSLVGFIILSSLLWFSVYLLFYKNINYVTGMSFFMSCLMFFQILFQGIISVWLARLKFSYEYIPVVVSTIVLFGLSPILSVIGIKLFPHYRIEAKLLGNAIAYFMVGTFAAISIVSKGYCLFSSRYWKYAVSFSAPLLLHYLASVVLGQADRIMISKMVSNSAAAIYAVTYSISMILTILTTSANQAVVPWFFRCLKKNELVKTKKTIYLLLLVTLLALGVVMLIGPEIIKILATTDYFEASWIIPPIMASLFFTFVYQLFANIEFFYKKIIYIIGASIVAALVNVILNYIFIPIYGYVASAYTTLVCYLLFGFFHYLCAYYVAKQNGIKWPFSVKILIWFTLLLLFVVALMNIVYKYVFLRYSIIIVVLIIMIFKYKTFICILSQFQLRNQEEL